MIRVLLPLDGSELSERALAKGLSHLGRTRVSAILLSCLTSQGVYESSTTAGLKLQEQEAIRRLQDYLETQAEKMRKAGHSVRTLVRKAEPVSEILRVAREEEVDFIAMGTRGLSGWKRLVLGSVAEGVARQADRPVLLVPPEKRS